MLLKLLVGQHAAKARTIVLSHVATNDPVMPLSGVPKKATTLVELLDRNCASDIKSTPPSWQVKIFGADAARPEIQKIGYCPAVIAPVRVAKVVVVLSVVWLLVVTVPSVTAEN
jgi:hypothetical protein